MAANTGIGLTAQEYYYYADGAPDLILARSNVWTPNYSAQGHIFIPPWNPQGDFILEASQFRKNESNGVFLMAEQPTGDNTYYLNIFSLSNFGAGIGRFEVFSNPGGQLPQVFSTETYYSIRLQVVNNAATLSVGDETVNFTYNRPRSAIRTVIGGAFPGPGFFLSGQITKLRLTDIQTPTNSRFYGSMVSSESMPTSTILVDELGELVPVGGTYTSENTDANNTVTEVGGLYTFVGTGSLFTFIVNNNFTVGNFYTISIEAVIRTGEIKLQWLGLNEAIGTITDSGRHTFTWRQGAVGLIIGARNLNESFDFDVRIVEESQTTNGILTNFPTTQPWAPVLLTNQAYLGNRQDLSFLNGIDVNGMTMSAAAGGSGIIGSWAPNDPPAVGSLLSSGTTQVRVLTRSGNDITYESVTGTNENIQSAFEYPNVFDIEPPP